RPRDPAGRVHRARPVAADGILKKLIEMKPAVGFTLPSAGVTPAPSINRKMARTPFCSQGLFPVSFRPCVIVERSEESRLFPFLCHSERSEESRFRSSP